VYNIIKNFIFILIGIVLGAIITLVFIVTRPQPEITTSANNSGQSPDMRLSISQEIFVQQANSEAKDILSKYGLSNPKWYLQPDNQVTMDAQTRIPIIDLPVQVRIRGSLYTNSGRVHATIESVDYGGLRLPVELFDNLSRELNRELENSQDTSKYWIESVDTNQGRLNLDIDLRGKWLSR